MFDCIYAFQDGRIVEAGSFTDIKDTGGVLSGLWQNYKIANE